MPAKAQKASKSHNVQKHSEFVFQFLIVLLRTDPLIWRRIQVPGSYTFWDLHVAIADAMGWEDYHLHEFRVVHPTHGVVERLGTPDDEFVEEPPCLPDWEVNISDYFGRSVQKNAAPALYDYDFGDDWRHTVTFEEPLNQNPSHTYPRCSAGAQACPPEDCGGIEGYELFLRAISDRKDPRHKEFLQWIGGSFDPNRFDPSKVRFDDPRRRWKLRFMQNKS